MNLVNRLRSLLTDFPWPGAAYRPSTEIGRRSSDENALRYQYAQMQPDMALRAVILDLRRMDKMDARVKKIHTRMAQTATKGGLRLEWAADENPRIRRRWESFERRLGLNRQAKLESDARGLVMEGNLAMQWVVGDDNEVHDALRMPIESLQALVDENGRFKNTAQAYAQYDLNLSQKIALFPLWQLTLERLTPDNLDDHGSLGRPYLDASRICWRQLRMTEEDLVIRRRQRAPLRFAHVLEGASKDDLEAYKVTVEHQARAGDICTDFYLNKKGGVTALQGDANLEQVSDVVHLLDTFFVGAPAPKGLFGYTGGLSRDILEDLKRDYYEELDALQDTLSWVYEQGFRLELLLNGIFPDAARFSIGFAERRTETPNQAADRALKYQALGVPAPLCWDTAGLDTAVVQAVLDQQRLDGEPYPDPNAITPQSPQPTQPDAPRVSITPGNAPKGESATSISHT